MGRNLRRALDLKVKKLRSLLTADEDITTELDRIVCRLMKLALSTSKDHQMPPPATWMQRKLLDLLSLTEKAIERRRKHFIENYPFKAIGYDNHDTMRQKLRGDVTLSRIQIDDTLEKIVDKYLTLSSDPDSDNFVVKSEVHYNGDDFSVTSNEIEPFVKGPKSIYGEVRLESITSESKEAIHLEITQGWIDRNYDVDTFTNNCLVNTDVSDSNTSNDSNYRYKNVNNNCSDTNVEKHRSDLYVSSKNRQSMLFKTNKVKRRKSKNKLIKKVSKKQPSSGQLNRKYSKKFEFVEYKSYTFNKPKIELKGEHNLQPTLSKPIPTSLIELCYQDLRTEKSNDLIASSLRNVHHSDNVAATKESYFIGIVTQDKEETLALRRTIATEVDRKSDALDSEAILETVINVTKDDSFDGDHTVLPDAVDSNTIFLYDLNEPSTSKGIRHISADVQCGTDVVTGPIPSTVTSLMNLTSKFETGIKISDSFTKLRDDRKFIEIGTTTDGINFYQDFSMFTTNAIKIKDSDAMLNKSVECSTMTNDNDFVDKTLMKPMLNVSRDSTSELRVSSSNLSKAGFRCLKNPSDCGMSQIISVTKYIRPKLSCCGIHVHSYRERQVSEDVVFQGEWQKKGLNILAKRSPCALLNSKKRDSLMKKKRINSKENIQCPRKHDKTEIKVTENKSHCKENTKYSKPPRQVVTKDCNTKPNIRSSITKNVRNNYKVSKVAPKTVTCVSISRSVKNICATKNKPLGKCANFDNTSKTKLRNKRDEHLVSNTNKALTSYAPRKLNKSTDYLKSPNKISPFNRSKTEDFKDSLVKFTNEKRKNLTYLVFRNEIENSRTVLSSSVNSKAFGKIEGSKNGHSPASQNSSPCSSPNSIVTVRALPTMTTSYCNKSNSSSPEKHNIENVSLENIDICKTKRYTKSTKANESSLSCENKENLPETSKRHDATKSSIKDTDKSLQAIVSNRIKNVFMVQVRAESPPPIARKISESVAKTRSYSNTKILRNKHADNHQKVVSPSCIKSSKNKSKSPVNSIDMISHDYETSELSEVNHLTRSSTPILDKIVVIEGQDTANEHIREMNSNVKTSNSKINAAMKQLIEERLNFIKQMQENNDSDSETVILSKDLYDGVNDDLSQVSYKTVVSNINTCNITGDDIENALLNYSLESNLNSLATFGSAHSRLPHIDKDSLSISLTESMTEFSEYLHPNELDNTLVPQQGSNTKTVRDLFERKDQITSKNVGGVLAVQVFSGFSMDGEPVVGDQPEYTRLVDPETGNLTLEVARQTTSEELFISGRSSDTYESCYVDDDAYVPNWLFHIISQQQSVELPEVDQAVQEPEAVDPLVAPEYDMNGNAIEAGFGAGVGAGDGHGMHSDQSQDSSGRGTSISSSDVSSGPQSEAILIDPSAFLGVSSRAVPTGTVPLESSDTSFRTVETMETDNETHCNRDNMQRRGRVAAASDADADVSSLETDGADSDN